MALSREQPNIRKISLAHLEIKSKIEKIRPKSCRDISLKETTRVSDESELQRLWKKRSKPKNEGNTRSTDKDTWAEEKRIRKSQSWRLFLWIVREDA